MLKLSRSRAARYSPLRRPGRLGLSKPSPRTVCIGQFRFGDTQGREATDRYDGATVLSAQLGSRLLMRSLVLQRPIFTRAAFSPLSLAAARSVLSAAVARAPGRALSSHGFLAMSEFAARTDTGRLQ